MPLNERTINSARNPKWANYQKTSINLEVNFDELDEESVEFNAHPDDIVSWGPELFNRAVAGEFGEIAEWVADPDLTGEEALERVRRIRDRLLQTEVDPLVTNFLRWEALTVEKQQEWKDYRQALLDLPSTQAAAYQTWNVDVGGMEWVNLTLPTKPE